MPLVPGTLEPTFSTSMVLFRRQTGPVMCKLPGLRAGQRAAVDRVWICSLGFHTCVDKGAGQSWVWEDEGTVHRSESEVGCPLDIIL